MNISPTGEGDMRTSALQKLDLVLGCFHSALRRTEDQTSRYIEIDGYADRQDLRLSLLKLARKAGVRISLGTDAHHPEQLGYTDLSLAAACLAKIASERIVNSMPLSELKQWVASVRRNNS